MEEKDSSIKLAEAEYELGDAEQFYQEYTDRVVILKKEPLPRKAMLMHVGVKDIRCVLCVRIRSLATAEELGDGWICEDCLSDVEDARRYGGQRGK
jgi:hypothetical protein